MKIIVVSSTVFRIPLHSYGGLEAIAYHCAEGLAKKGHEVSVVAPDGSYCPGCAIIPCGPAGMIMEKQAYGGFPEIKQKQKNAEGKEEEVVVRPKHEGYWQNLLEADAIIDHSWQKWSYELKREGRLKAPILGVCHAPVNTMYEELPEVEKPCFVCISKDQAGHFQALFNKPARVCYNGADVDYYKRIDVPQSNRFLFLARFSTIKGADIAIECCKKANVGLDLIGDTTITGEPEYLQRCFAMADGEQIRIHGGCTRGETVFWYSRSLALLHPVKRFREPFGLAPIEAMLCGLPCISWNNGAMRETIPSFRYPEIGTNDYPDRIGLLVSNEDHMVEAIKAYRDSPPIEKHKKELREHASRWSLQAMVDRYEELCQEAVKEPW